MKKKIRKILLGAMLLGSCTWMQAQTAKIVEVATAKNETHIVIENDSFYMGANFYVLRIGDKIFNSYERKKVGSKDQLIFTIQTKDYVTMKNGNQMVLTYGMRSKEEVNRAKENSKTNQGANGIWQLEFKNN